MVRVFPRFGVVVVAPTVRPRNYDPVRAFCECWIAGTWWRPTDCRSKENKERKEGKFAKHRVLIWVPQKPTVVGSNAPHFFGQCHDFLSTFALLEQMTIHSGGFASRNGRCQSGFGPRLCRLVGARPGRVVGAPTFVQNLVQRGFATPLSSG